MAERKPCEMRLRQWMTIGLIAVLPASKVQAGYGAELLAPLLAVGGTCIAGSTTGGVLLTANGGTSPESWIFVGATLAAVLLGAASESINKELVFQVKADHDIYLAGGEMTPFLQNIYREVQARSHDFDLKDGEPAGNRIDERKMTQAIDRMIERMGAK